MNNKFLKKTKKKIPGGIWVSNKFPYKAKPKVKPAVKKCISCKKRPVRFHHVLCNICWEKKHG